MTRLPLRGSPARVRHWLARAGTRAGVVIALTIVAAAAGILRPAGAQTTVDFPLGVGLRLPSYDRVDGLTLPFGPVVSAAGGRVVVDPVIAYRSQLGTVDPALHVTVQRADSAVALVVSGERGTFTNDRWIRSDLLNSAASLAYGGDARNYFRADRGEARVIVNAPVDGTYWVAASGFVGARVERDWSTGWRPGELRGPWSVFGRTDAVNGIQRPNPEVISGHLRSLIAGGHLEYDGDDNSGRLSALAETGSLLGAPRFTQLTVDVRGSVATVAGERFVADIHTLVTPGGVAPPQRWSYVGGAGTLATVNILERGGDHLFFVDTRYEIPVPGLELPVVGQPWVGPRFAAGAAAVGGFGRPIENIGIAAGASILRLDFVVNPESHRRNFAVGLSLDR